MFQSCFYLAIEVFTLAIKMSTNYSHYLTYLSCSSYLLLILIEFHYKLINPILAKCHSYEFWVEILNRPKIRKNISIISKLL